MNSITRRHFLGPPPPARLRSASSASSPPPTPTRSQTQTRADRLRLVWNGGCQSGVQGRGVEVVALCDVDSEHLSSGGGRGRETAGQTTADLQALRGTAQGAGPGGGDHRDAAALARAAIHRRARAGLDVYCEKPLSLRHARGPRDGRRREKERPHRADSDSSAGKARRSRRCAQHIQAGKRAASSAPKPQIHYTAGTADATPQAPPATLDWDLWCGPAPKIPYSPQVGSHELASREDHRPGPSRGLGHPSH